MDVLPIAPALLIIAHAPLFPFKAMPDANVVSRVRPPADAASAEPETPVDDTPRAAPRWGYMDRDGKEVLTPRYERADRFSEGLAIVSSDAGQFAIDPTGRVRFPVEGTVFPTHTFREGRLPVSRSEPRGAWFLDTDGKRIELTGAPRGARPWGPHPFSGGLARIESAVIGGFGNATGWVGLDGRFVIQPSFERARDFSEGLAAARDAAKTGLWGYIDKTGAWVVRPSFEEAFDFHGGFARVDKGYIDRTGKLVVKLARTGQIEEQRADEGRLMFSAGDWQEGYLDPKGAVAIPPRFAMTRPFAGGVAAAAQEMNHWGFIGPDGAWVISPRFLAACNFEDGLAQVILDEDASAFAEAFDPPHGGWLDRVEWHAWVDRKGAIVRKWVVPVWSFPTE